MAAHRQIFYAAETALAYSVGHVAHGLANNGMTDEQRATLSPDSEEFRLRWVRIQLGRLETNANTLSSHLSRVIGSKIQISGWSSYSALLWSLKASLLVLYLRMTVRHPKIPFLRLVWTSILICPCWFLNYPRTGRPCPQLPDPHLHRLCLTPCHVDPRRDELVPRLPTALQVLANLPRPWQ